MESNSQRLAKVGRISNMFDNFQNTSFTIPKDRILNPTYLSVTNSNCRGQDACHIDSITNMPNHFAVMTNRIKIEWVGDSIVPALTKLKK